MPRKPKERKIALFSEADMAKAVDLVEQGTSRGKAAKICGVSKTTLLRYLKKKADQSECSYKPNYEINKVFSEEEEVVLTEYIKTCSQMAYGQSTKMVRKLAYELGVANNKKMPTSWTKLQIAGKDWLRAFLKRNGLSIRQPEACSLSRMTSFNPTNVSLFFSNLKSILAKYPVISDPSRIFNLDETATTTVQKPKKMVAEKGVKQLCAATSAERGQLVTTCAIISATGTFLPPVMIFPRHHFKQHMLTGAPAGTVGYANPSGWMSTELFSLVMDHFIKQSHSSQENPSLLVYDNLEAHISIEVIDKARAAGVHIITLPPHCSHKLQPLDVAVFASFKAHYNSACDTWLVRNPGQTITIYNVADLVGVAFENAFTPKNIKSGFSKSGIYPFNDQIFTDVDFMISSVTDRPIDTLETTSTDLSSAGPSGLQQQNLQSELKGFISPEQLKGFPKAGPRKARANQRKKKKSAIITSTPEKNAIWEARKPKMARKICEKEEESESDKDEPVLDDEDDDIDECSDSSQEEENFFDENPKPEVKSWVVVEFDGRKSSLFYVGQILEETNDCFKINFLKRGKSFYVFPHVEDVATVEKHRIKKVLNVPNMRRGQHDFKIKFPKCYNFV